MLKQIIIQSFKHDGSLHRSWLDGYVLESDYTAVIVTDKCLVIDYNQRKWITKEPAICFFYPDRFYNVIAMIRNDGIHYYCNIASPFIIDNEALKNIDYDLDVKVAPDYSYKILDEDEYFFHKNIMNYPQDLQHILEKTLNHLLLEIQLKKGAFDHQLVYQYYQKYLEKNHV